MADTTLRVLLSDTLNPQGVEVFSRYPQLKVDTRTGLTPAELAEIIAPYHGLVVRSATHVTREVVERADSLRVIGRAGVGVDNIDLEAATRRGIVVMNSPLGNSITTAEHAISMMMALARHIPAANAAVRAGRWERSKFIGIEVFNKTLGVIGLGNIGRIVAERALGLKMKVIGYDPISDPRRGGADRGGNGDPRAALPARRFHHDPRAADPRHQVARGRGGFRDDEAGRADHQLRARRYRRRAGACRRARLGQGRRRGARRLRRRAAAEGPSAASIRQRDRDASSGRGDRRGANPGRDRYRAADRRVSDQRRDQPLGQHAGALAQGTGNPRTSSAARRAPGPPRRAAHQRAAGANHGRPGRRSGGAQG